MTGNVQAANRSLAWLSLTHREEIDFNKKRLQSVLIVYVVTFNARR
jgi:hypothetical protein